MASIWPHHKEHIAPTRHGESKTVLYGIWASMKNRCACERDRGYKDYGGRGITVCDEWKQSFLAFKEWAVSHGYAEGLQVDRIDNDGNYEPGNCRWATVLEQHRNKRNNRWLTIFGETKIFRDWVDDPRCAVGYDGLHDRLKAGWPIEKALTTPRTWRRKELYP